jgi:hypothetical protein
MSFLRIAIAKSSIEAWVLAEKLPTPEGVTKPKDKLLHHLASRLCAGKSASMEQTPGMCSSLCGSQEEPSDPWYRPLFKKL